VFGVTSVTARRPLDGSTPPAEAVERSPAGGRLPTDKVTLSAEARQQLRAGQSASDREGSGGRSGGQGSGSGSRLSAEQQAQVDELRRRDAHVRQHEAAHQAAGGDLTGAASFSYETGPDGRSYAVAGEVPVQSRTGRTPDETIAIARRVRAAALAPSDPSPADLAAAAEASQVELQAELQKRQQTGANGKTGGPAFQPVGLPAINLERIIVRSPEPEPFM
jgi:hypothetical protein